MSNKTKYSYTPSGVCSKLIEFEMDDKKRIFNLKFTGGCDGNLKAIGRLLEGKDAKEAADILSGNDCRGRGTSCADQLSKAIYNVLG